VTEQNLQYAPYPVELEELVRCIRYRPGWSFQLTNAERDLDGDPWDSNSKPLAGGLTLIITTKGYNSYRIEEGENYRVNHFFPVPPATYNRDSWMRWLLDQCIKVETHEACEFFTLMPMGQGEHMEKPFAPHHGPGEDPYTIWHYSTDLQRRTSFRGLVNE
jgi:hypothetical protein